MPHARNKAALYTSGSDEWYTPPAFARAWADFFAPVGGITLDPCADPGCSIPARRHIVGLRGEDGLSASWAGEIVGVNPPYSDILTWVKKFLAEDIAEGVFLVPSRTDTRWVHRTGLRDLPKLEIEGRLKFQGGKSGATFPSLLWYRGPRVDDFIEAFDPKWGYVSWRCRAQREHKPLVIQSFLCLSA